MVWVLSMVRDIRNLRFTSAFGIVALAAAVGFASWDGAVVENDTPRIPFSQIPLVKLDTYPLFLGNAAFLYLISTAILPISQNMQKPQKFAEAFSISAALVTLLNVSFGLFAMWAFGGVACAVDDARKGSGLGCVQSQILDNLQTGYVSSLVKIFVIVDLLFTTVVFIYPWNEALTFALLGNGSDMAHFWK
jgi:phage shock protein PspC (stress-responsive transcriptional regulator)